MVSHHFALGLCGGVWARLRVDVCFANRTAIDAVHRSGQSWGCRDDFNVPERAAARIGTAHADRGGMSGVPQGLFNAARARSFH